MQSPELTSLPATIREALRAIVPNAAFSEENLSGERLPVTLMDSGHAIHAFAIGDERDYAPLYEAFKKHYMNRGVVWATKDVSFVFCLPLGLKVSESFPSAVEVDVYFCRKYVVQLSGNIASSFARLPFLPLAPISTDSIRPPSAKALLRRRGLKTELANSFVEPGTGPAKILENCLSGKYGPPPQSIDEQYTEPASAVASEQPQQALLKSISIENFRAYREKKEFKLGSAVTILYGPNGFGKTSFFDAVDFVVTGGVGRLKNPGSSLTKIAKHLDSKEDEPTLVSLRFTRNGKEHVITRDLANPNQATLDGNVENRKTILSALTGAGASNEHVDNLVALFRATHLFSQDHQELTGNVANKCSLPSEIVSRMLAFDDYVNGLKKVNEVIKIAEQNFEGFKNGANKARADIVTDAAELTRLEALQSIATSPEVLDASFNELEKSLLSSGIELNGISIRDTRALRVLLEAASGDAVIRRITLETCLNLVTDLRTLNEKQVLLKSKLEDSRSKLGEATAAASSCMLKAGTATNEVTLRSTLEEEAKNLRNWYFWAVSAQPESVRLASEVYTYSNRLTELANQLQRQKDELARAEMAYGEAETVTRSNTDKVTAESSRRAQVQLAETMRVVAEGLSPRLYEVRLREANINQDILQLNGRLHESIEMLLTQQQHVARIEAELNRASGTTDRLKGLIAELRSFVSSGDCLLCGHDHGSSEALITAIDQRIEQADIVVQLRESLSNEQAKQRSFVDQQQSIRDAISQAEQQLGITNSQRQDIENQLAACDKTFASIGLVHGADLQAQIANALIQTANDEQRALNDANKARESLAASQNAVLIARQAFAQTENEQTHVTALLNGSRQALDEISISANRGRIDFSIGLEAIQTLLRTHEEHLAQANLAHQVAIRELDSAHAALVAAEGNVTSANAAYEAEVNAWNEHQANIHARLAALAAYGLDANISDAEVLRLLEAAQARTVSAKQLLTRAEELEVASDAAATSAAFHSIRSRIEANQNLAKQMDEQANQVFPWLGYLTRVSKLLGGQQAIATERFTSEYGPRTAVIQRRLRPVYGFDDIEVSSKNSAIEIHVSRNGEELRPTDFFSQSQIQTLVLGLFLTACSSQTWSGFSSIMMDDPVTHFDDLNTYALLDLISGLQSSSEGERQFVISTCDEKLLQLARYKFKHLGEGAKFYRFSAIGGSGPMISEIPA